MSLATGTRLGPYEILGVIGAGGMGEVYKARDSRLDRIVAIKTSQEKFSDRFEREAKAVAALNHPNICTLHDVGPDYLVMELIEGKPLHGALPIPEIVRLALQITDALDAAHKKGIVHRDLKPGNIMVTNDGRIKVLDFGLAQFASPAVFESDATKTMTMTEAGMAVGTVAYMSPEQARGEVVDARSDIWSFGVVLYELVAGVRPFRGETAAVIFAALLNQAPASVRARNPEVSAELEAIIRKALEKDRELRYQSAADLRADLKRLERPASVIHAGSPKRLRRKYAIVATALMVVVGAFVAWHRAQAKPLLTDKDVLVLAAFTNTTGDPVFDDTLREALAVALEQSPFLSIMGDDQMREGLRLMGRSFGERITNDIAREICQRENQKATIGGSIASLGKSYVVSLEATNCRTGEALAREQVQAEDKEQVLKAVSTTATAMRAKLGESLSSIQKLDQPLDQVTTTSLEALQAFALAGEEQKKTGSSLAPIPFLSRAAELDPNFAMAWEQLASVYHNSGDWMLRGEYTAKAYALVDHVSERERLEIRGDYYEDVTGERDKALDDFRLYARTYPRYQRPHNVLGSLYFQGGEYEKAASEFEEGIRLEPDVAVVYVNLGLTYIQLDRFDKAKATIDRAFAAKLDTDDLHFLLLQLAVILGDRVVEEKQMQWFGEKPSEYQAVNYQVWKSTTIGQLRDARQYLQRATEMAMRNNLSGWAAYYRPDGGDFEALVGSCESARSNSLAGRLVPQVPEGTFPTAFAMAFCGDSAHAQEIDDDTSKRYPLHTIWNAVHLPTINAVTELRNDQAGKAVELLQSAIPYERAWPEAIYVRGLAYLRLHKGPEAAVEFQKILDHKGANWGIVYSASYVGLARAATLSGDAAKAKKAYQDFFTLWKDADSDVPLLVEARKEYAALK